MSEFWNMLAKNTVKAIKAVKPMLITAQKHPKFYKSISDLAQKMELGFVPHVLVADNLNFGPVWMHKLPNGGADIIHRVVTINKAMMEATGAKISKRMSPALEAVMAHEFSHLKDGTLYAVTHDRMPYIMPLVGMAGLWLYDKARAKSGFTLDQNKKEYGAQLINNVNAAADESIAKTRLPQEPTNKWQFEPSWQQRIIHASRYLLVAAIGAATGVAISRQMSLSAEFRAEGRTLAVTRNPELMKKLTHDLHHIWREAIQNIPREDIMGKTIMERFKQKIFHIMNAHPSPEEMTAHIDRLAAQLGISGPQRG